MHSFFPQETPQISMTTGKIGASFFNYCKAPLAIAVLLRAVDITVGVNSGHLISVRNQVNSSVTSK